MAFAVEKNDDGFEMEDFISASKRKIFRNVTRKHIL